MKQLLKISLLSLIISFSLSAQYKTENVFIITTDGLRWQEVFGGVDSVILNNPKFTSDRARIVKDFVASSVSESRQKLMPFFWNTLVKEGQIYGNRNYSNFVNNANPYWFSYPGYNEILSGYADIAVNSNDKKPNENITVLEFLNNQTSLKGKVAAYATWDVIPYIINENRSGIPVNAGLEPIDGILSEKQSLLNEIQGRIPSLASDRFDFITYFMAKEYIRLNTPKVFFLGFDETDEFAHESKYREYLYAANTFDKNVADLWNFCQNHPQYKNKTTFIITTDHGRGNVKKDQWTSHGQKVEDCNQIWIAVIGPDTKALGEVKDKMQLFQNQIARTAAHLLGYSFLNASPTNNKPTGSIIESVFK